MKSLTVWRGHSTRPSLPAGTARKVRGSLPHGKRNRLILQEKKNRKLPLGNSLLYISILSVALITRLTSNAILNDLFAICNSRLLPTNQIVNCDGRARPSGAHPIFLFYLFYKLIYKAIHNCRIMVREEHSFFFIHCSNLSHLVIV